MTPIPAVLPREEFDPERNPERIQAAFGLLEPALPAVPAVIYLLLTQTRKQGHESFLKSFPKSASFPWEAVKGAWDELTGSGSATQRESRLSPAPLPLQGLSQHRCSQRQSLPVPCSPGLYKVNSPA